MNIRTRLTLIFFAMFIAVLTVISLLVYVISSEGRQTDFFRRLRNRAINTAQLLVEVEEVNVDLLQRMERNNPASLPNQYIVVYDKDSHILYQSETVQQIPVDSLLLNNIRQKKQIEFRYSHFEVIGFLFTSRNNEYVIVAGATDVYGIDALHKLRNTLIIILLISAGFIFFLGWFFAGRVLLPIARIVRDVDNITEKNLKQRLDEGKNTDELGRLAATFNRMLQRLQNAFSSQKTFIANASHEIRTPITAMSGEIEVTLLHDRDKAYYVKTLRSILIGLKTLNKLSTQLLALAQTDAEKPMGDVQVIRIDDVLWEAKDELAKVNNEYIVDIQIPMGISHDALSLEADDQLLKVAIMNVMDNGCKYSDDRRVEVSIRPESSRIVVDFANTGAGIPEDKLDKIFDPFFRANAGKKIRGSGIGLSLVKRIVQMHNGEVTVQSNLHQKTVFTLAFPAATKG